MGAFIRFGGVKRRIGKAWIYRGGSLRRMKAIKLWRAGGLRVVETFSSPISAVASPPEAYGYVDNFKPVTVISNPVTAAVTGGVGPFTYSWTLTSASHAITITDPAFATTSFSAHLFNDTAFGTAHCTVTDSLGAMAGCDCEIRLTAESL